MKILIVGALGAGKSTLAYHLSKKLNLPRLNLDEIARNKQDGSYRNEEESLKLLHQFTSKYSNSWIAEGSHIDLIKNLTPNLIVFVNTNRFIRLIRFTIKFVKAKKLIGKEIDPELPVQAYHYRKLSLKKIRDYDVTGLKIIADLKEFFKSTPVPIIKYKNKKDLTKILNYKEINNDRH